MTEENEKLKKDMKIKEQAIAATGEKSLVSSNACNMEALSSLTKKLQEISTTYDDVRRDMTKLQQVQPLSFTIYLEIVLSIKSTNQKHGGFDVTVSLFSWGHPLTTAHA